MGILSETQVSSVSKLISMNEWKHPSSFWTWFTLLRMIVSKLILFSNSWIFLSHFINKIKNLNTGHETPTICGDSTWILSNFQKIVLPYYIYICMNAIKAWEI